MSYKKVGALVKVEWGDAWGSSGWTHVAAAVKEHQPLTVTSVGFVLVHDAVGISLAEGKDANGSFIGQGFIPAGMIKKVTKL